MKLKNILSDLKVYGKNYVRSRSALFFVFIFPLIFMLVFGSIFSGSNSSPIPLYVQNLDGNSTLSTQFMTTLNSTNIVQVHLIPESANITQYISQHSISSALLIPNGFATALATHGSTTLVYYNNPSQSTSAAVQQVLNLVISGYNHPGGESNIISLVTNSVSIHATSYTDFLIPGLIGLVILTSPMFSMTFIVSSYKKEKIFRQLSLTPLKKSEWFIAKFIWYLFLSAISAVEIIAVGIFLFHSTLRLSWLMAPFIILGVFMFTSLGILAGSISKTEEGASIIGNVITFPMMFLAGTFFPVEIMPGWLQTIAHVLPLYYIINGLNAVTVYSNMSAALNDIIISIVVSAVFFIVTIFTFSWKEE